MTIKREDIQNIDLSEVTTGKDIPPIHPGEYLQEVLEDIGVSAYKLCLDTEMPKSRISQIIKGNRAITPDTAIRLSRYLGTSARYWMNLQIAYDLKIAAETVTTDITPYSDVA